MNARTVRRHRLTAGLGLAGGLLGVVAGVTQATVGDQIPQWTGAKQAPVALGLLTVALSLVAGMAAGRQHRADLSVGARAACALALAGPGLLCLSTVGRLWFPSAGLLIVAGVLTIDSWRDTAAALSANWMRVLLGALGVCELVMSAGAAPAPMVAGALGGAALVAAAWMHHRPRWQSWVLVAIGTVPFAALAWTSIVPLLVTVEAFAVAAAIPARGRTT
ncbi:hypothetical protein [Amycolatopsis sp. lyj-109]|uniref:hypothetical protein n=1 Tax=Amycolatopsis sp. lyj-109 TaxID=2789287 RepID=UPI003978AF71